MWVENSINEYKLFVKERHDEKLGSIPDFHHLAAAAGNDLAFCYVKEFVADGAVNVTFFFCPGNKTQAGV